MADKFNFYGADQVNIAKDNSTMNMGQNNIKTGCITKINLSYELGKNLGELLMKSLAYPESRNEIVDLEASVKNIFEDLGIKSVDWFWKKIYNKKVELEKISRKNINLKQEVDQKKVDLVNLYGELATELEQKLTAKNKIYFVIGLNITKLLIQSFCDIINSSEGSTSIIEPYMQKYIENEELKSLLNKIEQNLIKKNTTQFIKNANLLDAKIREISLKEEFLK